MRKFDIVSTVHYDLIYKNITGQVAHTYIPSIQEIETGGLS